MSIQTSESTSGGCGSPWIVLPDRRSATSKVFFSSRSDRAAFLAGGAGIRRVSDCKYGCIHPTRILADENVQGLILYHCFIEIYLILV